VQKIGENISLRRFERLEAAGKLWRYLHGTKIGVLVDVEGNEETGKDVAMHIAFAKPSYMKKDDVPADVVAKEKEILSARASESGKPAEIVARMIEGGINKFLGEISLLGQPFVKDDKQTIEKMLASRKATLHAYRFFVVGEGIEKKSTDFAAEVMAQAGLAR
jgi:elongation factor Ts